MSNCTDVSNFSHPFLQYPIFKLIMEHLDLKDLLCCRAVCSQWKSFVNPLVKTKTKLVITGNEELQKFLNICGDSLEDTLFPSTLCLRRIEQCSLNLEVFAETITSMHMWECEWDANTLLGSFCQLPRLNTLSLCTSLRVPKGSDMSTLMGTKLIFEDPNAIKLLPSLEGLHIHGDYTSYKKLLLKLFQNITSNLKVFTYQKMHRDDNDPFGVWLLNELLSCDLGNLVCLELEVEVESLHVEIFKRLPGLRSLSVNIHENYMDDFINILVYLKKLKAIDVGIIGHSIPKNIVGNIQKSCPNVEKISIHCPCYPRLQRKQLT